MQYRRGTAADADELAKFGARLFVDSYQHLMERDELETYVRDHFAPDRQHAELLDPALTTFLAVDAHICGYAQLLMQALPACDLGAQCPAELKRIYVDPGWHGSGVARELLRFVEGEAQQRDCDVLWLAVWEVNKRAISFYGKHGFRVVGRQGFPIGNEEQTDHVMAKALATELH